MFIPIGPEVQHGEAMRRRRSQSQNEDTPFPIQENLDGTAQEPQHPISTSHHPAVPYASMSAGLVWQQQDGDTLLVAPAHAISGYDASGEDGLYQHPHGPYKSVTSPYAMEHVYSSPAMQNQDFPVMNANNNARQEQAFTPYPDPSQTRMYCKSDIDPTLLQPAEHDVYQSMSGVTATGFKFEPTNNTNGSNHNFRDHNHFIGSTSSSTPSPNISRQTPASFSANGNANANDNEANDNGHATTSTHPLLVEVKVPQHEPTTMNDMDTDMEPPAEAAATAAAASANPNPNSNTWSREYDDLIRRLKHKKKTVKQIVAELRSKFGVKKTANAVSKRWTIIKKMDSKDVSLLLPSFYRLIYPLSNTKPPIITGSTQMHLHHHLSPSPVQSSPVQ